MIKKKFLAGAILSLHIMQMLNSKDSFKQYNSNNCNKTNYQHQPYSQLFYDYCFNGNKNLASQN